MRPNHEPVSRGRVERRMLLRGLAGSALAGGLGAAGCAPSRVANVRVHNPETASPMPKPHFIEISHVIEPGMVTYPGLPAPEVKVIVDHESSRERYQNKSE